MKSGPNTRSAVATILVLVISVSMMWMYLTSALHNRLGNHLLPSKTFGVPSPLRAHGYETFYDAPGDDGSAGQFYFFIANDLAVDDETRSHLDADAYRYQQILLPLAAWVASRLTLQDWVTPLTYFATNLLIVMAGVFVGARYLASAGVGARWIIPWALSLGVQLSLMNGLPDAVADAMLTIAIVSILTGHRIRFALFATLAVLGRSSNVALPLMLMVTSSWAALKSGSGRRPFPFGIGLSNLTAHRWLAWVPLLVFVGWQFIVRVKFGHTALGQLHGLDGPPFRSWFRAASVAFDEAPSRQAMASLLVFAALIITVGRMAWNAIPVVPNPARSLAATVFLTALASACFGDTQMSREAEYMRPIGLLFLSILIWPQLTRPLARKFLAALFAVSTLLSFAFVLHDRLVSMPIERDRYYDRYLHASEVTDSTPIACFDQAAAFKSKLSSFSAGPNLTDTLLDRIRHNRVEAATVEVTNESTSVYHAGKGVGSVNLTYRWFSLDGASVVAEGIRSFIPGGILPGQTKTVSMLISPPRTAGSYLLRVSLVQEHCSWFYDRDANSKVDVMYDVK